MPTTDLGLGLTLVDNPVAADDLEAGLAEHDEEEEEELVVLPAQLERIGELLSTPAGKPTALYKGTHALLTGFPLWNLLIADFKGDPAASVRAIAMRGEVQLALVVACLWCGMLLAGPAAVYALRHATRPRGFLTRLGAGTAVVRRSGLKKLEASARTLRRVGTGMVVLITLFTVGGTLIGVPTVASVIGMIVFCAFVALWSAALCLWWHSLKAASALTAAPVDAARRGARAEAKRLHDSGESMDPERWRFLVEEPTLKLGRETLRTLSRGWGLSVLSVGAGLFLFALFWAQFLKLIGWFSIDLLQRDFATIALVLVGWAIVGGLAVLPFALAWEPAAVSSNCAKLEDDINDLYQEDPAFVRALHVLKSVQSLNKQQGLGFVVGGQVVTKRTLWILCTGTYSALAVFGPTLEGELGLTASLAGGAQHASCEFGWTFADDSCFKLFGDGVLGQPLGWADAEVACQEMGSQTHLASVTSEEQQRAVQHLASSSEAQGIWIGLNDMAEECEHDGDCFVWSDGEPLEYSNWLQGMPNNNGNQDAVQLYVPQSSQWQDYGETTLNPYICAKKATPVFASGGDMLGCAGGHWVMGTPYQHVASLSYLPPTIAYGIYEQELYDQIAPLKISLNETVTTAAACAALVHRDHRAATAAEYSNIGGEWCTAVFEA